MNKFISDEELRNYLEAEKQRIVEEYGEFTEETISRFVREKGAERFHDEYYGKNCK